jgi:hypothetical protein
MEKCRLSRMTLAQSWLAERATYHCRDKAQGVYVAKLPGKSRHSAPNPPLKRLG